MNISTDHAAPEGIHDRQASAGIGRDYDLIPYFRANDQADPALQPATIAGLSNLYGGTGRSARVLDLGCGSGALLDRVARYDSSAELLGIDISAVACAEARRRLAPLGERASIVHGDLLELDFAALGQFDMIYAVGFAYCVPPSVTERFYELLRHCLARGGVAVIGHYAGALPALNRTLFAAIRHAVPAGATPAQAIALARVLLRQLDEMTPRQDSTAYIKLLIRQAIAREDEPMYHEVLNPHWRPLQTAEMGKALASAGIGFACSIGPANLQGESTSTARIAATELRDAIVGGHRYSLFVRSHEQQQVDLWSPALRWQSLLSPGTAADPAHRYWNADATHGYDVQDEVMRRFIDATCGAPVSLSSIAQLRDLSDADQQALTADVLALTAAGVVRPTVEPLHTFKETAA